ncbi:STT3 domain-containing protein, partial [Nitrosopumilus sp. Nsub]|uniref:STT3 domain-containing protein n=1 Tax=Nitrosopumilus sp. Nsub TaxID=1776294 RepID=UPI0032AFFF1C
MLRSQVLDYGYELNEFDPFFNYRATQYIVDNGIDAYFEWNDSLSWYPNGRDVSATSQVFLHLTAASTYWIFGGGSDLYDFTILFPVIFSSLSVIVIFALVRVIGGTSAGLFSALLFSISIPLLIRSPLGWFKSEPLGLFLGLLTVYLFLSGINSYNKKIAFIKLAAAGIFTAFSISSWGGNHFFIIPIGIFFFALPFLRNDHKFIIWAIPLFTISVLLSSFGFERIASNFILGLGGLSLIASTLFLVSCILIQTKSSNNKSRNALLFLISILIIVSGFLVLNSESAFLLDGSHRYLNALNPFLTSVDPLVDSVAEHATPDTGIIFLLHSILMIFSGLGIWIILSHKSSESQVLLKNDMKAFVIIFGITGAYVSSTFIRLELFASLSLIILAAISLSILTKNLFKIDPTTKKSIILKISFVGLILTLFVTPLVYPDLNWISAIDSPP